MRSQNFGLLRRVLIKKRLATKPELAEASGLSVVTVNNLLKDLLSAGEVQTAERTAFTGGRPALQYRYYAERKLILVGYMYEEQGQDRLHVMLVDLLGESLAGAERSFKTEQVDFSFFTRIFQEYVQRYPAIVGVLVGLPGVEIGGRLQVIDYPELRESAFSADLATRLERPVSVINDINAVVAGYGALQGKRIYEETIVGIYWPQSHPPGAGILLHGKIYLGRDGMAGEIGGRFSYSQSSMKRPAHEESVGEVINLLTQMWNPHELVFYDEQLTEKKLADIREKVVSKDFARILPDIKLRRNLHQDYRRGMCILAGDFLRRTEADIG